jgi:hypothetical protein
MMVRAPTRSIPAPHTRPKVTVAKDITGKVRNPIESQPAEITQSERRSLMVTSNHPFWRMTRVEGNDMNA